MPAWPSYLADAMSVLTASCANRLAAAANCEHLFVVAPAVVDNKQRDSFETLWAQANGDSLF